MNEEKYWLGLKLIPQVDRRFNQLLNFFGSPQKIWEAPPSELKKVVSLEITQKIAFQRGQINLEEEIERVKNRGIYLLTIDSPNYPPLLREIHSPPPVLFIKGEPLKNSSPALAIVGSRRASSYGKALAEELAGELSRAGITIVSGLARGIDTAAHYGAVRGGEETIGVLGSGLDVIYPPENKRLYQMIAAQGALLSEHPLGVPPLARHFPPRNRIISGLSLGVVVVEADEKSGALITVDFALEQGREVFALPGNVKSNLSKGTHKLLKQGACLIEKAEDILDALNIMTPAAFSPKKDSQNDLSGAEKDLLEAVGWEVRHIDEISREIKQSVSQTSSLLTFLELKGYIRQEVGKRYLRVQ